MANPRNYSTSNKLQKGKISSIIEEFSEELMEIRGKCMDIGCGPGDATKELLLPTLGPNAQIIGTDISEDMIKFANETWNGTERLQFEVLDIQTKNLPKKYFSEFDHIFSFHTLQWCNDIQQAFKNIYQMLRPNGTILLYPIVPHEIFEIFKMLEQDIRFAQYIPNRMKNISPFQESSNARRELKELLKNVGFTVRHCSLREASYSEQKLEHFLNSIISVMTFREDMPQNLKEEYENTLNCEFVKRSITYKSAYNNQELTLELYKALLVYAQKI